LRGKRKSDIARPTRPNPTRLLIIFEYFRVRSVLYEEF